MPLSLNYLSFIFKVLNVIQQGIYNIDLHSEFLFWILNFNFYQIHLKQLGSIKD